MRLTFPFMAAGTTCTAAVDKQGKTVDFLLRRDRGIAAAEAFFRKALASHPRGPRKVTIDGHVPSRRALWRLRGEHPIWRKVEVRICKYLNNIVEQDHRAIKRRCASMIGFKSFYNASIALAGVELAHRNRKRQFSFGRTASSSVNENHVGDGDGVNRRQRRRP
jgi:transposase-like protein